MPVFLAVTILFLSDPPFTDIPYIVSTALTILTRSTYIYTDLTILDSQTPNPADSTSISFPDATSSLLPVQSEPSTASLDSSRIVRADYASPIYSFLGLSAQKLWRQGWGGAENYHENGLILTCDEDGHREGTDAENGKGMRYVDSTLANVRELEMKYGFGLQKRAVQELYDKKDILAITKGFEGADGDRGYINWGSGWANAAGAIRHIRSRIAELGVTREKKGLGKVTWKTGSAERLIFSSTSSASKMVKGVVFSDSQEIHAQLTILCTGAWTSKLLDVRKHLTSTGQVLSYIQLTPSEADRMKNMPVLMNMSTGMFVIPPTPDGLLKVARHGHGYRNPIQITNPECESAGEDTIEISIPHSSSLSAIAPEGESACRDFLSTILPSFSARPFHSTRTCWYTDTPNGDFIIDYHPEYSHPEGREGLFLATGGSGHGFKFFPVLGEKIIDAVEGRLEEDLKGLWKWGEGKEGRWETEDGCRGGERDMEWENEWRKS